MAQPSPEGSNYVRVGDAKIWWQSSQPTEIHYILNDDDFEHPETDTGLWVKFSSNPKSANYHPANFNRCARVLKKHGKPAPDEVPEGPRRLDKR